MRKGTGKTIGWPALLIVLQSLVYGFGDPISKIAFDVVPAFSMMTVRYTIAFAAACILFRKRVIETLKTVPVRAWLIPGVFIGMSYILNNVALAITEATSVAFIRSLSVVITPAFAFLIYKKRFKFSQILIQILVLPGLYLLCVRGGLSGFGTGEIVTLLAAAMTAAALVSTKRYLEMVEPASLTALMAGCSAALAAVGSVVVEGGIHMEAADTKVWLIILYLALACTLLGYLLQNLALTRISEREVSLLQTLCPVMTALFAFVLLGEKLSAAGITGALIIIACVIAASLTGED